ncbi:armadillo repeat protein [Xylaria nigripes]|nr:armadillo repeat protein [Xylaria nigripes]
MYPEEIIAQLNGGSVDIVAAIRLLKNDLIGDTEKKRIWVQRGVVPHVVRLLRSSASETDLNEERTRQPYSTLHTFTDDETAHLQALQLLASLAHAGPAFISPLFASGVLSAALDEHHLQNRHPEIVLAALHTIREIVVATASASISSPISLGSLADIIFTDTYLESLHTILSQRGSTRDAEAQITLVADLVRSLCREERHQTILVTSGILDALATRLASIAVAEGYVLPKAEIRAGMEGLGDYIPEPAISRRGLDEVLGAIAAIVTDSPFRVCKLIYSPAILAIFPNFSNGGGRYPKSPAEFIALPGLRPTRPKEPEIMDLLLAETPSYPRIPKNVTGSLSSASSPYSSRESPSTNGRPCSKLQTSLVSWTPPEENATRNAEADAAVPETPLVPWLIHLLRTSRGTESLMATSLLTSLFKTGFAYKAREASIGLLVIPVLLGLLENAETKLKEFKHNWTSPDALSILGIIEEAPAILAQLITDSEIMQKAAYECGAVKMICKLLKSSYDTPLPAPESRPWSPDGTSTDVTGDLAPECQLGDEGQHRQVTHYMRVRESTLRALSALATFKESYRKAILDQDVVTYIVDSLNQVPSNSKQVKLQDVLHNGSSGNKTSQPEKNPVSVIIAACYAIRMLSRSVKPLRTALVDHSVSKPLFDLLRHPDVDVQIAATACLCNLLLEFSPMRESLIESGVLTVLCEHAHSLNSSLRLNALWALKHLVDSASIDLKKQCVEELESGWLVRLICDDTEDEALFLARNRSERHSASTTPNDLDEDVEMSFADEQNRPWLASSLHKTASTSKSDTRILQLAESRLEVLKEIEQNPVRKARHDDLAIQEQGLDFIRNLIGGAHSGNNPDSANDTTEMIDYLLSTLTQDHLFAILASKLKPKVLHPFNRRASSGSETRVLPPQTKIIEAVIYILVHIAASVPRHRQLVIAQTDLLKQLAKLFNSQDREVRVALCHLINNLTWQDDMSDASACSLRATELRNLGFLKKLEALGQSDDELDVRERAKCALWQMKNGY